MLGQPGTGSAWRDRTSSYLAGEKRQNHLSLVSPKRSH
ncbi:hypothetical protein SPLC1_S082090 [Arthrospira platensis C1]|nr:hypothetical protein SPLC1_S082090 [Arthrospira platensis C1]